MHISFGSRTTIMLIVLCTTMGLASGTRMAWAAKGQHQDDHAHAAPHGGKMISAGTYHLEVVVKDQKMVQIFVYDNNSKPIEVLVQQATLYLRLPGNKRQTLTLKTMGSGPESYLAATVDLHDVHSFEAALRIALDGQPRNLRFSYHQEDAGKPHAH